MKDRLCAVSCQDLKNGSMPFWLNMFVQNTLMQTWNINAKNFWQDFKSLILLSPVRSNMLYNAWQGNGNIMPRVCIFPLCVWRDAKGYRFHCWDWKDLDLSTQWQIYLIWQFNPLRDALTVIKERTSALKVSSALTLNEMHNPTNWLFHPSEHISECNLQVNSSTAIHIFRL